MSFPNLSALAVRERSLTLFFLLLSVIGGVWAFVSLGRAEDPAFTVRVMVVSAVWPGATTEQMQRQVVDRLEKRIQEVEYLYKVETTIRPGRADLQVEFHDFTPQQKIPELQYQVRKRMQDEAARLPQGVVGPLVNDDFADVYFTVLALTAPGLPMRDLAREADAMRDRLQRVPGVHKALVLGERSERVFLDFDNARLANLGIAPQVILDAIDAHNRLQPAGLVETRGPRLYVRVDADLADLDALRAVPVRIGQRLLRLDELATVRRGYEDPPSYLVRSRGQDAVLVGVVMAKGENGLQLGQRLDTALAAEHARLPLGMALTQLTNQAHAIKQAVDLFQVKFLVAVAVVMGVSFLAIGWRAGLVVGLAVPITLGLTFALMKLAGINLDRITLGALIIALGLLVDDAIIAIEMMLVKMEEGWERTRAAGHAWNVTAAPMLYGTLVTVAGFVPIGFARSGVGEYAGNIFWVLAFALLVSWLVAVVFTPYLGVKLLPAVHKPLSHDHGDSIYQTPAYRRLRAIITWCVVRRKTVLAGTVVLLVAAIAAMAGPVQKQFFPGSDRPEALISISLPPGSAIAATDATVRKVEKAVAAMPDVKTVSAYVGAGAPRFFISANPEQPDPAFGKIVVVTTDDKARDRVIAAVQQQVDGGAFPEARVRVYPLLYGPPVIWPVTFRVVGPDPLELRGIAHRVRETVAAHPNTVGTHLEWDARVPVLDLRMDTERLRLFGLTPRDVAQQLQFQLDGVAVAELRQDNRSVQLRARGTRIASVDEAAGLELRTLDGRKLTLAQLGRIDIGFEEPVVKRYNREPFVAVLADVQGAQPPDVMKSLSRQLDTVRASLPEGYRIDIGGTVEQSAKAEASIEKLQPVMVALMLIFIMLQMRSFSGTFIVVATAPLGVVGAVVALLLFNQPFGFVALLGMIGLAGILMRNTMILTQQVSDNFNDGLPALPAVVEAAVRRARPVVLTAIAAALAFVPLTFDPFWGPLAYVLIGGVLVGTAITLLFVPALYAAWFRIGAAPASASA